MAPGKSILVVDDDQNLAHTLSLILRRAGYSVTTAIRQDEACRILEGNGFNLVILDLKTPDKTLIIKIFQIIPGIHLLVLTGNSITETNLANRIAGKVNYLYKPADPDYILAQVCEILTD